MIENRVIDGLKNKLSILNVIAHDGLTIVQRGNKFSTQEHDSLILYPDSNSWAWFSQADQHGQTLGGDIYAWYQHIHRCSFSEAHSALSAMAGTLPPATVADARREAVSSAEAKDYREFAVSAWNRLRSAQGEPVAAYLAQRSISLESAKWWGLGAHRYQTKTEGDLGWAVTFPYVNTNGQTVVNMRLIERNDKDKCRHWGQRGGLFGARLAKPSKRKYLFAVEGELNTVSSGQACSWLGVDVVSIGNKSLHESALAQLVALAGQYRRLFIWTDDAPDTQKILGVVPGAIGYKSPKPDGQKMDANDMLRRGLLTGYVATILEKHADRSEAQRLYAALYRRNEEFGLSDDLYTVTQNIIQKWGNPKVTAS